MLPTTKILPSLHGGLDSVEYDNIIGSVGLSKQD